MVRLARIAALLAFGLTSLVIGAVEAETALDRYIAKPDPHFRFTRIDKDQHGGYDNYFLYLWSQQWRSPTEVDRTVWEHEMSITVPWTQRLFPNPTAVLIVNGGSNKGLPSTTLSEAIPALAVATNSVVVVVNQIPNQPLYFAGDNPDGRKEDAIIAYSFDRYLRTRDPEWPVLLPMTKAVVRAMDAAQLFLWTQDLNIDDFIVAGGSKRGWTTWLTAAVDKRVRAILPASIDLLNLDPQLTDHYESYGFYAPAIADYSALDVFCRAKGSAGAGLRAIIDPFEYRDRLTMPKLIANSAGDDFFISDSSNHYYHRLRGDNRLRYSFNTDHSQDELGVFLSAVTWLDDMLDRSSPPRYDWRVEPDGRIVVQTFDKPKSVRLRLAHNPVARDFRLTTIGPGWGSIGLRDLGGGVYVGQAPTPANGWTAYAVEMTYSGGNGVSADHIYTTDVVVTPSRRPFVDTHCMAARQEVKATTVAPVNRTRVMSTAKPQARFRVRAVNTGRDRTYRVSVDTRGLPIKARVCVLDEKENRCVGKARAALNLKMRRGQSKTLLVRLKATDALPSTPSRVSTRFADGKGLAHGMADAFVRGR